MLRAGDVYNFVAALAGLEPERGGRQEQEQPLSMKRKGVPA